MSSFDESGLINYEKFPKCIEFSMIEHGSHILMDPKTHAIEVAGGTTGSEG